MEFSQFAGILYSVFGNGVNVDVFTQDLFRNITEYEDDEENPIEDYTLPAFKAYFNGTNGISRLAKKINKHLEPEKFVNYLN